MKRFISFIFAMTVSFSVASKESAHYTDEMMKILLFEALTTNSVSIMKGKNEIDPFFDSIAKELEFPYQLVRLEDMVNTIENNELAAEIEYANPFFVSGTVDKITRSMGRPLIRVKYQSEKAWSDTVSAFFDETSVNALANLDKGRIVTIACESWDFSLTISFKNCKLMPEVFEEFRLNTKDPRNITKSACEKSPHRMTVILSRMSEGFDTAPVELKKDFVEESKSSKAFKHKGLTGNFIEKEEYSPILKSVKGIFESLHEIDPSEITAKNC